MFAQTARQKRQFHTKRQTKARIPTRKLLCFWMGSERYGIPIERVRRVHPADEMTTHGILPSGRSLVRVNQDDITLIDLSTLFAQALPLSTAQYLIVCTVGQGDLLGFPVSELPTVVDVPLDRFSALPETYRQSELPTAIDQLVHLSHPSATTLANASVTTELFYLNLDQLL